MIDCSKCRYFYGYDGVGELWTGCSIHGDFKGQKRDCNHFEKKVTKSDLLIKIQSLENENEQLRQSRDYWCKSAKLHSKYFNCLEKAIERAYEEKPNPTDEDINMIYAELEMEIDDD